MSSEISIIAWLAIIVGAGFLVGRRLGSKARGSQAKSRENPKAGSSSNSE